MSAVATTSSTLIAALVPIVAALVREPAVAGALREALGSPPASDELVPLGACGLDRRSADRAVADGRLPAARIGRRIFVRRIDVARLFDELAAEQGAARVARKPANDGSSDYGAVVAAVAAGRGRR